MAKIPFDQSFFYKLNRLKATFDTFADRTLTEDTGVGLAPRVLLSAVRRYQPATQQKIVEFMGLTPGAISRQVDAAKKNGWLTVRNDKSDRRKQVIELTPAGTKILEAGDASIYEFGPKLFPSEEERLYMMECLDRVQAHVDELNR